jgi:uncharacterized protein YjbJ (UPF0337 family)
MEAWSMSDERLRGEGEIDKVKGNVKQGVGKVTGDQRTEGEGKLDEVKGNIKEGMADLGDKAEDTMQDIKDRF